MYTFPLFFHLIKHKNDCVCFIISGRTQTKSLPLGVRFEWENQLANIFSSLHKVLTTSISSSLKKSILHLKISLTSCNVVSAHSNFACSFILSATHFKIVKLLSLSQSRSFLSESELIFKFVIESFDCFAFLQILSLHFCLFHIVNFISLLLIS